jgi:dCMP deaminase
MVKKRLTWHQYAMRLAEVAALRSEDIRKVGACALDKDNRVIGLAYNGLAAGKNVDASFWLDRDKRRPYMLHAETNLLSLFRRGECNLVAVTLLPCQYCATMLAAYGIKKVLYKEIYHRDTKALDIFKFYGIKCTRI